MSRNSTWTIGNIRMTSPIILESGPFAHDGEGIIRASAHGYGAVTTETITMRDGKSPKWHFFRKGETLFNCSKWSDISIQDWLTYEIPKTEMAACRTILSLGHSYDEVRQLINLFKNTNVAGYKIVSYLPVDMARMIDFAKQNTNKPVWAKISPNWENNIEVAKACVDAGADALVAIDSYGPVKVPSSLASRHFAQPEGWLSGEAIHALALRTVRQLKKCVDVDIIGVGGIRNTESLLRMKEAGATGYGLCTALLLHGLSIIEKLRFQSTMIETTPENCKKTDNGALNLLIDSSLCNNCGLCVDACGYRGWAMDNNRIYRNAGCRGCGLCLQLCPENAIQLA